MNPIVRIIGLYLDKDNYKIYEIINNIVLVYASDGLIEATKTYKKRKQET